MWLTLLPLAFVAGFVVRFGLVRTLVRSNRRLRDQLDNSEARHDAYRLADTRADLDQVPMLPEPHNGGGRTVRRFDQDNDEHGRIRL